MRITIGSGCLPRNPRRTGQRGRSRCPPSEGRFTCLYTSPRQISLELHVSYIFHMSAYISLHPYSKYLQRLSYATDTWTYSCKYHHVRLEKLNIRLCHALFVGSLLSLAAVQAVLQLQKARVQVPGTPHQEILEHVMTIINCCRSCPVLHWVCHTGSKWEKKKKHDEFGQ